MYLTTLFILLFAALAVLGFVAYGIEYLEHNRTMKDYHAACDRIAYLEPRVQYDDDAKDIEIEALKNRCSYLEDMYADLGQRVADLPRS